MREMKDSGIEWIGEIPKNWKCVRLKYIVKQCTERSDDNIGYIGLENIESGSGRKIEKDDDIFPEGTAIRTQKNDVLFGKLRPYLSKSYLVQQSGCCSTEFVVMRPIDIAPRFLKYITLTSTFVDSINVSTYGAKMPRANWEYIGNIFISLPSMDLQIYIADYLDRKCNQIDAIIARQQEVIEKLKAYKLSIITEAVTKGLNPDVPMKDSGVEWIGKVPDNWTKVKLKSICQFINGDRSSNYPSPNEYVDDGIPFLGADSLCGRYVDITQSKKITKEKYYSMGGAKIRKGDILYTLRGSTIGKNAMATFDEGTVASSLMVIRPISLIPEYLLYWLNSEEEFQQRQSYINGSTAPNLSAENVGSFVIFLPSVAEQREISDYLDKKCAEIELTMLKKQMLVDQLSNYKKSLIYEVVTGKKEV